VRRSVVCRCAVAVDCLERLGGRVVLRRAGVVGRESLVGKACESQPCLVEKEVVVVGWEQHCGDADGEEDEGVYVVARLCE
jgi:hypothetical protein